MRNRDTWRHYDALMTIQGHAYPWCDRECTMTVWDNEIMHEVHIPSVPCLAFYSFTFPACLPNIRVKKHMLTEDSAYNGVFLVNSLPCCVVRLLLWPVCMLRAGRGCRQKVLLSCGGITNGRGTLCGFFVVFCHVIVHVFGTFYGFLTTWPGVNWVTFGTSFMG